MKKVGTVVGTKRLFEGTVLVEVVRKKFIPGLKVLSYKKKFIVHTENKELKDGDRVIINDCAPVSKMKRHIVMGVVSD